MPPIDPQARERAESAYQALFARIVATPGLDAYAEFNGGATQPTVNQLFDRAGYTLEQRGKLAQFLSDSSATGQLIDKGSLWSAGQLRERNVESLQSLQSQGLLSERRATAIGSELAMMSQRIEDGRPARLRDAQSLASEALRTDFMDGDARKARAQAVYETLLDAGFTREQAGVGYHALHQAMEARSLIGSAIPGDAAHQTFASLSTQINELDKIRPPVFDATNMDTLRTVQGTLKDRMDPIALGSSPVLQMSQVRGDFQIDPATARENAPDRIEKLETMLEWYASKNKVHSMGGYYDYVFKNAPGALQELRKQQQAEPGAESDVRVVEAMERAEKVLGTMSGNFRNQSPAAFVAHVEEIRASSFRNMDALADALGEIPIAGPVARAGIKGTMLGLKYASGEISGVEAVTSALKEGISSTVDVMTVSGKTKWATAAGEAVWRFGVSSGNELQAEVGKAFTKLDANPNLDKGQLFREALTNALVKGFTETFGKQLEKFTSVVPEKRYATELLELGVGLAKKFGIERQVEATLGELRTLAGDGPRTRSALDGNTSPTTRVSDSVAALRLPQLDTSDKAEKVANRLEINASGDGVPRVNYVFADANARTVFGTEVDPKSSMVPVARTSADVATALNEDLSASRAELAASRERSAQVAQEQGDLQRRSTPVTV